MVDGNISETTENYLIDLDFPSHNLFGLRVHSINEGRLAATILDRAIAGRGFAATYATAYTLAMVRSDDVFRDVLNSFDMCYPDGSGVAAANWLLGQGPMPKTTANRYFLSLCKDAISHGLRIALIGARPGVPEKVADVIRALNGQAQIWTCHGFGSIQSMTTLGGFEPNLVFLALGQPKQEKIALEFRNKMPRAVIVCVGGLFDFIAHVSPNCPEFVRSAGMEWAFRLATRPRQVWRRYLIGLPVLGMMLAKERLRKLAPVGRC